MNTNKINEILHFWFGELNEHQQVEKQQQQKWWKKSTVFDAEIKQRFEPDLQLAISGKYDEWLTSAQGALALIILLDQFSRNIYRDDPRAYAQDDKALHCAQAAVAKKVDQQLPLIKRVFIYMPFEHAEVVTMQQRSVELFSTLVQQAQEGEKAQYEYFLDYAKRHYAVIEKYGRFPHRNEVLNRAPTAAELDYLSEPGAGF